MVTGEDYSKNPDVAGSTRSEFPLLPPCEGRAHFTTDIIGTARYTLTMPPEERTAPEGRFGRAGGPGERVSQARTNLREVKQEPPTSRRGESGTGYGGVVVLVSSSQCWLLVLCWEHEHPCEETKLAFGNEPGYPMILRPHLMGMRMDSHEGSVDPSSQYGRHSLSYDPDSKM